MLNKTHTVFLRGGLGNQFFQWTFALWLKAQGRDVALDSSFLRRVKGNQTVGEIELLKLFSGLDMPITSRFTRVGRAEPIYVRLAHALSILRIEGRQPLLPGEAMLHYGYYQTPRYFIPSVASRLQALLRPEFRSKSHEFFPSPLADIRYAAVHLRGGDYLQAGYNITELGLLSNAYYERVISTLADAGLPIVLVSDDDVRARRIIHEIGVSDLEVHHLADLTVDAGNPMVALAVMLNAKVLACANSSFSALCGYLNPQARVLFPQPWFRGASLKRASPALALWHGLPAAFESR